MKTYRASINPLAQKLYFHGVPSGSFGLQRFQSGAVKKPKRVIPACWAADMISANR